MRGRLEDEIAAAERDARGGRADPALLVRLAQLYVRAGRAEQARATLLEARGLQTPVAEAEDGSVELAALWHELDELLQQVDADLALRAREARRLELVRLLEGGGLSRAEHDELLRLELQDGLPLHPEPARCPACKAPLADNEDGGVRCSRSGRDGDLCRHVDVRDLYRCGACGLVVRAWSREAQGRFKPDPHEPPLGSLSRSRCPHCGGPVADWSKHAFTCPRTGGDASKFPRCTVCRQRGHHARELTCPRCHGLVATVPCLEGFKRRS